MEQTQRIHVTVVFYAKHVVSGNSDGLSRRLAPLSLHGRHKSRKNTTANVKRMKLQYKLSTTRHLCSCRYRTILAYSIYLYLLFNVCSHINYFTESLVPILKVMCEGSTTLYKVVTKYHSDELKVRSNYNGYAGSLCSFGCPIVVSVKRYGSRRSLQLHSLKIFKRPTVQ